MRSRMERIVLLSVTLAFSLSGCGGPDVGVTSEEIKIGTWAPLSGPASSLGTSARAMEVYFQSVNDQGGVHGRKLNLLVKDDAYDPARTPTVVKELVEQDEVFAIVGGHGTANCLAVREYLGLKMIPWINPGSGSRVWTIPVNAYVFSIYPSYVTEGRVLAKYGVEQMGADKVGLFYQDDSFGREGQEGVRLGLKDMKKELAVAVPYKVTEEDLSSHAQKLKDAAVDTVMLWAIPSHAARLLGEFKKMEFAPKLLASEVLSDPVMLDLAGETWEGAVVASGVPDPESDEPGVVRAREIMSKYAPDVAFGTFSLMGMVRAEVLVEGMRRAGPDLRRLRLILALEGMDNWSDNILGQPITFNKDNHQGFDSVRLMKVEDGKYHSVTGWLKP